MFSWMGLLEASVAGGICILLFAVASQLWGQRYWAGYKKVIWLLIGLRLCIPVTLSLLPQTFTVQVPVYVLSERGNGQALGNIEHFFGGGTEAGEESANANTVEGDGTVAAGSLNLNKGIANTALGGGYITSNDILVLVWGIGFLAVLFYYLIGHGLFCRKIRQKSECCTDKNILAVTIKISRELGLKRIPQVRVIKDVQTGPFTVGFFRNMIVLPDMEYQERDLQYIIRHELVHCADRDTRLKVFYVIINAVHWFNPLVWLMKSMVDQDMELECDEKVLMTASKEERSEYSEILMSCIGTDRSGRSVLSTGYVHGVKFIKKRFSNIFNTQKKSGKAIGCVLAVLLAMVSGMIGFEAGRTVYAKSGIVIDYGIELRTDVTGDGVPDMVAVHDDESTLMTTIYMETVDGAHGSLRYDEDMWASSYLVSGDLSGNGAADIVLMRISFGMHLVGEVSVLHVAEGLEPDTFTWQEYPDIFIQNPAIAMEQPASFDDIECIGATVIEENGRHYLRLIALDMVVFDDDTVQCIDCSLQEGGWYIEDMQTVTGYYSEDKIDELLKNNTFNIQ